MKQTEHYKNFHFDEAKRKVEYLILDVGNYIDFNCFRSRKSLKIKKFMTSACLQNVTNHCDLINFSGVNITNGSCILFSRSFVGN